MDANDVETSREPACDRCPAPMTTYDADGGYCDAHVPGRTQILGALARAMVRCGVAEGNGQAEALSLLTELWEQYATNRAKSYAAPLFCLLVVES